MVAHGGIMSCSPKKKGIFNLLTQVHFQNDEASSS